MLALQVFACLGAGANGMLMGDRDAHHVTYEVPVDPEDQVIAATFEPHHVDGAFYPGGAGATVEEPATSGVGTAVVLAGTGFLGVLGCLVGLGAAMGVFGSRQDADDTYALAD